MEQTALIMKKLKQRGCQFALDDFGADLTSLNYLKSLPIDVLKIDGMFIRNILEDNVDRMFVKSIISIAHTMDMKVDVESIESKEILQAVTALGVDYGQGYALGKTVDLLPQVV
jgi:EAL domain-containing protein (putative c-di-GMP-specific phosphodiesterase class I)